MTHTKEMSELEGSFSKEKPVSRHCPKCNGTKVTMKVWESSDGAYEDEKFTCGDCDYYWWVDGPDS